MFHISMYRERLRNALTDLAEHREYTPPPPRETIDEFNEQELVHGIGIPLADAAARADLLFGEVIELYDRLGDRPFRWYRSERTTEAVLRNSYMHPRIHQFDYWKENGDQDRAYRLLEDAFSDLRAAEAPPMLMAEAAYNLACVRVYQRRIDEAIASIAEAFTTRPDLKEGAPKDLDLAPLRDDPRFQELIKT